MIDSTPAEVSNQYIQFLCLCIEKFQEYDLAPFLLPHDRGDVKLACKINETLNDSVEVIREDNAAKIKGIISKTCLVVSARFHGVVSSLSQGIPCISTGWSHKYRELMLNYECEEFIIDISSTKNIESRLEKLLQLATSAETRPALQH